MGPGRPGRRRTQEGEEVSDALHNGLNPGQISTTDMRVAINNGKRLEDIFFTVRVGKSGSSGTFQQGIPQHFATYHPELNGKNVTLENASGGKWLVFVLRHQTHIQTVVRFSKGWRAFSKGNNLRVGDFLIFTQIGQLHFKVTVYDCHGKSLEQPPNAVEALPSTATADDCRGKALAAPAHVKTEPPSPTALPLQPLTVAVKLEYPLTQPAIHDSNLAKIILRHILPPAPSGQFPDPHITATRTEVPVPIQAPTVERSSAWLGFYRDVAPKEEQNEMEVAEGKDYMRKSGPTIVAKPGSKVGMYCTGEQLSGVRIHSPSGKQQVSTPEVEEPDDNYSVSESDDSDDDFPSTRLPRRGSMMSRGNYERGAPKRFCVRRPNWKGGRINIAISPQAPFSATTPSPIRRSKEHEVGESSQTQPIQAQKEYDDGEAVRLLHHQGKKNFSKIVCKHRQHDFVSATDKKRALDAAMEFSSRLKNHTFVAVMCAAQVYHSFFLPVPAYFQEATGTHGAKVVEAWLTYKDRKIYMVNWAWSEFWKTPMLNNDGWAKFALDHFLEEGDVCVFELVNSTSASTSRLHFHVHIFRVEEAHRDSYKTPLANTFPTHE